MITKYSIIKLSFVLTHQGKGDSAGGSGGPTNIDHREGRNRKGVDTSGSNGDSGHGSGSNGERSGAPRLPQKEKDYYGPQNWAKVVNKLVYTINFLRYNFKNVLEKYF